MSAQPSTKRKLESKMFKLQNPAGRKFLVSASSFEELVQNARQCFKIGFPSITTEEGYNLHASVWDHLFPEGTNKDIVLTVENDDDAEAQAAEAKAKAAENPVQPAAAGSNGASTDAEAPTRSKSAESTARGQSVDGAPARGEPSKTLSDHHDGQPLGIYPPPVQRYSRDENGQTPGTYPSPAHHYSREEPPSSAHEKSEKSFYVRSEPPSATATSPHSAYPNATALARKPLGCPMCNGGHSFRNCPHSYCLLCGMVNHTSNLCSTPGNVCTTDARGFTFFQGQEVCFNHQFHTCSHGASCRRQHVCTICGRSHGSLSCPRRQLPE